jgi:hypothetical protein
LLEDRRVLSPLVALSTNNQLLAFDSSAPGTIEGVLPITGLPSGESIVGIDVRPKTGQLYGLGSSNHLYVINTPSGAVTQVGTGTFAVPLSGAAFGFNFDPVAGDIRVISDTGQNMQLNPDTGAVIQSDTNLNPPSHVVAVAYTNKFPGATSTTLFGIDSASDMFVQIGGTNGNPSPDLGAVTPVAPIGAPTSDQVGFDIDPTDNTGFASVTVNGAPELIRVSLTTGPSPVGPIGNGSIGIRGLTVAALPPPPSTSPPSGATLFAVTRTNQLLQFSSATPGTITSTTPVSGLQSGETLEGLAVRPATGQLYALGSTSRLYTIDPATGAATQVGTGTFAVPLIGKAFGFGFDPVADDIRVISDADLNMRLNPDTGTVIDSDPNTPGIQPDQPLNSTYTVGLAYTNQVAGTPTTTAFGIDGANGQLVSLGGPDGSPSPDLGQVTPVGSLGVHIDWVPVPTVGFDIAGANTAFAALPVNGTTSLYTVDLTTGKATTLGPIGAGTGTIVGLAAASPGRFSIASTGTTAAPGANAFQITVNRTAGAAGQVTVDYNTADGTAVAGQDYAATHGTLVFVPGQTSQTIIVPILNPSSPIPKSLVLTLSNPTGGASLASPSSQVLVTPSFPGLFSIASTGTTAPANAGAFQITVTRTAGAAGLVTVDYNTTDGTAVAGQDYTPTFGTLVFQPGQTSQTITIPILNPQSQTLKTLVVTLSNPTGGARLAFPSSQILTITPGATIPPNATPNQCFVMQLYRDLLGREVDPAGLATWTGELDTGLETRSEVALGLGSSTEFRVRELQQMYATLLKRSLDDSGATSWLGFLQAGGTMEQVEAGILGSPEYYERRGAGTDAGFLNAVYSDVLGRAIDSAGLTTWVPGLQAGQNHTAIAQAILDSLESNTRQVEGIYHWLLGRDADPSGLATFVGAANQGVSDEAIAADIAGSSEYMSRACGVAMP